MPVALDYLIFDYSEDDEGTATWDAMANVPAPQFAALEKEVLQVLLWADQQFPRQRGAIDEGATWDFDLHASTDAQGALRTAIDWQAPALRLPAVAAHERITLTLTLSGRSAFADAFVRAFEVE